MVPTAIAHGHVGEDADSATSRTRGTDRRSTGSATCRPPLRAVVRNPALRAVRYRVGQDSGDKLVPLVAWLTGDDSDPLKVPLAAAATDAVRIALEVWAESDADVEGPGSPAEPAEPAVRCLRELTGGMRLLMDRQES